MSRHPIEDLKEGSRHLRGDLAAEVADGDPSFSKDAQTLIKFHGFYQQKERGVPQALPTLMLRGRIPGGRLTADQYLAWDDLATQYGDGTLRLTTRQSIELHGVLKADLKATLQALAASLQTTKGACGDVVRTVTQAPNPWLRPDLAQLDAVVDRLATHFQAVSNAYTEIWLDGERVDPQREQEKLLGPTYLPRKFKFSVTAVGENLVDLYTNDLGLAATFDGAGLLDGFFVFAGGGMGMTHGDDTTFPRVADQLGWVPAEALIPVAEAAVGIFREEGNREDRKRARLKYVIARKGVAWFCGELTRRSGVTLEDRPLPPWRTSSVLGWLNRTDGTLALGLSLPSGRLRGELKAAVRVVVAATGAQLQLSPDQDLILLGLDPKHRPLVETTFQAVRLSLTPDPLASRALACVALPLCGMAFTEGERSLPSYLDLLRAAQDRQGLTGRSLVFRVTGCANGCARPYTAELALVGQSATTYKLFVGGDPEGTRLAFPVAERVPIAALPDAFDRLFAAWAAEGQADEPFGRCTARLGADALKARLADLAVPPKPSAGSPS